MSGEKNMLKKNVWKKICGCVSILLIIMISDAGFLTPAAEGKPKKSESPQPAKAKATPIPKEYQDAVKASERKDWKKAIDSFLKAIKKLPSPQEGYFPYSALSLAYLNSGDAKTASSYCALAQQKGERESAVQACLLKLAQATAPAPTPTPKPAPKEYLDALKASEKGDFKGAASLFLKAIKKAPNPYEGYFPYVNLGIVYLKSGNIKEASRYCDLAKKKGEREAAVKQCAMLIIAMQTGVPVELETPMPAEPRPAPTITQPQVLPPLPTPMLNMPTPLPEVISTPEPVASPLPEPTPQPTPAPVTSPLPEPPPPTQEAATEVPTAAPENQTPGNTYAVIIGIGNFQDTRIPSLRYTVNDAQGMYDVLIDPRYNGVPKDNVKLLLDGDATTQNIKRAIGTWLRQQAAENDTIIIYYASHGASEKGESYWVTYNADIDDLYATALNNNEVADMLSRVESKRVITLLDSCYSAATVNRKNRTRDLKSQVPLEKFGGEGRVTISASTGEQLSLELDAYEHGVFTYYVLEGLKGAADGTAGEARDGVVEVEELWSYVRNNVKDTAKKQGNKQTPVLQGSLTAGIPLAYDEEYLKELEQKKLQAIKDKQAKLQALFEQKKIPADKFDCAFQLLDAGKSDAYIDSVISGDMSAETFNRLFKCPAK